MGALPGLTKAPCCLLPLTGLRLWGAGGNGCMGMCDYNLQGCGGGGGGFGRLRWGWAHNP
eukprot:2736774-Amphidinium_carterae.1